MEISGKKFGQLLAKYGKGESLNDKELGQLIKALEFLVDFCSEAHIQPLASYYSMTLASLKACQLAREEK